MRQHIWEDPQVQGIGRLPMRSMLLPYENEEQALRDACASPEVRDLSDHPWRRSLDGLWDFCWLPSPDAVPSVAGWTEAGFGLDSSWTGIQVPGTWTRQGFDKPHYTNVQMPFEELPPHAPKENPVGLYRTTWKAAPAWANRRVVLVVGSAESVHTVFVNGIQIGSGKDTRLPSEYDITNALIDGENTVAIMVVRYSDASFVEDQDQWWFGGLQRSVYLYCTDSLYVQDIDARASIAAPDVPCIASAGMLDVVATLGEEGWDGSAKVSLDWSLCSLGNPECIVGSGSVPCIKDPFAFPPQARVHAQFDQVDLWSHEHPNLYLLLVTLRSDGKQVESRCLAIGWRSVQIRNRSLIINGSRVLIKGVNRHEHDQHNGKTPSVDAMLRDILLLKSHHFNAVRTCHYPDDERWYELCDRWGIYLVDEANIESHAFYDRMCSDPEWAHAFLERGRRMVMRDKNHPSVIVWSLGNESGYGANHDMLAAWIRSFDPSRPIQYEGAVRPKVRFQTSYTLDSLHRGVGTTDIVCPMYPPIDLIRAYDRDPSNDRPLIMCEYSHAMGNSNGSLSDYWNAIRESSSLQGGFIWDWIDQGLSAVGPGGIPYWKYGGDFGDSPSDYDFCLNGLLFPDQSPKPALAECAYLFQPVSCTWSRLSADSVQVHVLNRFDFTNLDCVRMVWKVLHNGTPVDTGHFDLPPAPPGSAIPVVVQSVALADTGVLRSPEIVLHASFELVHDVPWATTGATIAQEQLVVRNWTGFAEIANTGVATDGCPLLASDAVVHLFRPPTENDGLKNFISARGNPLLSFYYEGKAMYNWLDLGLIDVSLVSSGDPARMAHLVGANGTRLGTSSLQWRKLDANSWMLSVRFLLDAGIRRLPRVGITCAVSSGYKDVQWYGKGPHEAYPDRQSSAMLGLHQSMVSDLEVPYIVPQEQGCRMDTRFLVLSGPGLPQLCIEGAKPFHFSITNHTDRSVWQGRHTIDLDDTTLDGYWLLNLDAAQRGLGTASCGPDTLEQYEIHGGEYSLDLVFTDIS